MSTYYSQIDPQWSGLPIGKSGELCGQIGCLVVAVAILLRNAGYTSVTPQVIIDWMDANDGFTADGELIWEVLNKLFPQIHYGGEGYSLLEGHWTTVHGTFTHWLAQQDGGPVIDPYYGTDHAPAGFVQDGEVRRLAIDSYVEPAAEVQTPAPEAPVAPAAPEEVPAPVEAPVEQAPAPAHRSYTVVSGDTFGKIIEDNYSIPVNWAPDGAFQNKIREVASFNGIADPNVIQVGQVITFPDL